MPRKGIPTNWRAAEYSTALAGVVKTVQSKLLNGESVEQHKEDFIHCVVELVMALPEWNHDLLADLNHALGVPAVSQTIKANIVEQPKPSGIMGYLGGKK